VDYSLVYTQKALKELAEIIGYIAEDDASAASQFGESLLDHIEVLRSFPRMGESVLRQPQFCRLLHSPVFVYYRICENSRCVEVLHLRHAAREPYRS
jgi:plasmid stabilization system protein ParE